MAMPETAGVVESAVDATRASMILEHVKQNNVAYLVTLLISHQLGILDKVIVWGSSSGLC